MSELQGKEGRGGPDVLFRQDVTEELREIRVRGVAVPTFLYGTAWKEGRTENLVLDALAAGFRGIDTANQRRHYYEEGVGRALDRAFRSGKSARADVFLQTKFTHRAGQDHRVPYDTRAPLAVQVEQSFESSLENLGVEQLDGYLLHGPTRRRGLGPEDVEAWRAMEALHDSGRVRLLGASNLAADQLEELVALARVPPAFVQNRCFARTGWDQSVREICRRRGIVYQAFSLLTANGKVLGHPSVREIAARHGRTVPQVLFRFALALGTVPLTGTSDPGHMREDLEIYEFDLPDEEIDFLSRVLV